MCQLVDPKGIEPNRLATQHIKATDLQSAVGNRIHILFGTGGEFRNLDSLVKSQILCL